MGHGQQSSKSTTGPWPALTGILLPILFPGVHMTIFYYLYSKQPVDRDQCTCNCWDNVFKGPYENGTANFKYFYFNSTWTTFKIWILAVTGIIALYESMKQLMQYLVQRKLRWSMALLFLSSIFSHYYAWWGMLNYYNDEFHSQWYHQLFFTLTELATTILVFRHLDRTKDLNPSSLLVIVNIALFHIFLASLDQFVSNVLLGKGELHQVSRDILMMSTDVIYVYVATMELRHYATSIGDSIKGILLSKPTVKLLLSVNSILLISCLILVH